MQALLRVIKWLGKHLSISTRNLNAGDPDAKPRPAIEVGIKTDF